MSIRGIRKRLSTARESFTLRVEAFDLAPGDFVAVTGRSGSGKSTMLDLLSLIAAPDRSERFTLRQEGHVIDVAALWQVNDDDALSDLRRASMGYVLQSGGLCSFLSVRENVLLPLRMAGLPANARIAAGLLAPFGMERTGGRDVRSLSGGERQRVAIVRALAHRPGIVFADEPTAALDFTAAQIVLEAFAELAREAGSAVVFVTHDPDLVAPFADYRLSLEPEGDQDAGRRHRTYVARKTPGRCAA